MQRYKIVVAYDGTDFHGWQIQPNAITIVSLLQKSFYKAFAKEIVITGASRTDAGVHALGQVATFVTDLQLDNKTLFSAWNNSLPGSIVIRSLERVEPSFHIFADVVKKKYLYHLFYKRPLPFVARYGFYWKFIDAVDYAVFSKALSCFIGEHDFRSFCKNEEEKTTVRSVDEIRIKRLERIAAIQIAIEGKGFLRYQIRRMIGAALDVARGRFSIDFIEKQLENPNDQQEFTRACASGLCLRKIIYKKETS